MAANTSATKPRQTREAERVLAQLRHQLDARGGDQAAGHRAHAAQRAGDLRVAGEVRIEHGQHDAPPAAARPACRPARPSRRAGRSSGRRSSATRLITLGPGIICATAQSSRNSSAVSQRFFSTISRCTTASTPPKPCSASQVNETNRSRVGRGCGRSAAGRAREEAGCIAAIMAQAVPRGTAPTRQATQSELADNADSMQALAPMPRNSSISASRPSLLEGRLRPQHGGGPGLLHGVFGGAVAADRDLGGGAGVRRRKPRAARSSTQLSGLMGAQGARAVQGMLEAVNKPKEGIVATVIGHRAAGGRRDHRVRRAAGRAGPHLARAGARRGQAAS